MNGDPVEHGPDRDEFIRTHLRVASVPAVPEIRLYAAHPGSGLWRLEAGREGEDAEPPYWAYQWAGGLALARYILDRPETVRARRVLDLGAGSGLVGIAAARAGASKVIAAEIDRNGVVAIGLNAGLNGVTIAAVGQDITAGPPPAVDVVAVGDLFYAADVAVRVTAFLDRCLAAGIEVLVGDPGRDFLPLGRLRRLAEYAVQDVGNGAATKPGAVFCFERDDIAGRDGNAIIRSEPAGVPFRTPRRRPPT